MEKELYITQSPQDNLDSTALPTRQRNIHVKALNNPNDRRNQVSKKVLSNFPSQNYYDDKKIKPGNSLYKVILETEDKRRQGEFKGPFLQINMHPTVVFNDNVNTMIYNQQGIIKTMNYISYEQYLVKLNNTEQQIRSSRCIEPLIMIKSCNGINFQNTVIMNDEITSRIIPRSENAITTKFIMPYAAYPNIIRLFYTPKSIKNMKKNIAYKVINRKQMTQQCYKRKYRMWSHFMVNVQNEESYIATLMKGKALYECEAMAESLSDYLQHVLFIQISEVVIDFIVDDSKIVYFNDIKAIKSKAKTKLWQIGTQEQIIKMATENNNQIMCRLCGMLYSKKQMQKIVTNKLIYELAEHLQNRGQKLSDIPHMKKQGLSNVCHLCYELIKAEHTLINVERQFANLMNIRQGTVERVQSKETKQAQLFFYDEEDFQKLGKQTSKFKKWRLFFYIEKLKRIPQIQLSETENIDILLQMKFQNQKQHFLKTVKNQNYETTILGENNITTNYPNSIINTHGNFLKLNSASSEKKYLARVRSAVADRKSYNNEQSTQNYQIQCQSPVQDPLPIQANMSKNKKSQFNEQSTCVTHSQSYFSTIINDHKSIMQSANNTTLNRNLILNDNTNRLNGKTNNLDSLDEDIEDDCYGLNNVQKSDLKKESKKAYQNILHNSSLPQTVKLDKVKMFIFYTKSHENEGNNFLSDEEIQFTLTFAPRGTRPNLGTMISEPQQFKKFTGRSSTLNSLKSKQTCQRHSLEIYLFDQGMKYCNLELTVGIISDGEYDDEGMDLERCNNLYWGKTYSCEPLPDQWMQVFTNGEEVPKGNMEKVLEVLEQNNFETDPVRFEETETVNYLKTFENFALSTAKPFLINDQQYEQKSVLKSSNSTTALKKTSIVRCKTALNRTAITYTNLLNQQKMSSNKPESTRNYGNNHRKSINSKRMFQKKTNDVEQYEYLDIE